MDKVPSWLVQAVGVLLGLLIIVVIVTQVYAISDRAQGIGTQHTITITAEGKVTAAPDIATMNASVQVQDSTAAAATAKLNTKASAVVGYVKVQGIDAKDITTSNYNVSPQYDYTNMIPAKQPSVTGYMATETVTIKIRDLTKVGSLIDGVVQNGANNIDGINYTFDNPDNIREQARELALTNAKAKAESLASAAGVQLGKLVTFSEQSATTPYPVPYAMNSVASPAGIGGGAKVAPVAPSEPGTQDITADVSVTYAIK